MYYFYANILLVIVSSTCTWKYITKLMANLQNAPGHTNCALNVCIQAWGMNYCVLHNRSLEVQGIHQPF